jgi:uncharacterized protein (TIGR02246 family)
MIRAFAIIAAFAVATPARSAEPTVADRDALHLIAKRMDDAWTAGDADANAELFAADATARFGADPLGTGREQIRLQFQSFFKDRPIGLRHVTNIERIVQLGPDLALWDAEVRVEKRLGSGQWTLLTRIKNVTLVVRQVGGWRIQAVRAFPVQ